jgi:hypothetical protein
MGYKRTGKKVRKNANGQHKIQELQLYGQKLDYRRTAFVDGYHILLGSGISA